MCPQRAQRAGGRPRGRRVPPWQASLAGGRARLVDAAAGCAGRAGRRPVCGAVLAGLAVQAVAGFVVVARSVAVVVQKLARVTLRAFGFTTFGVVRALGADRA